MWNKKAQEIKLPLRVLIGLIAVSLLAFVIFRIYISIKGQILS